MGWEGWKASCVARRDGGRTSGWAGATGARRGEGCINGVLRGSCGVGGDEFVVLERRQTCIHWIQSLTLVERNVISV